VYLRPFFDILAGVDAVVFGDIRKIHHHPGAYEEVLQLQAGDIPPVGAEVERSVEMGSHMVGVGNKLSVGTVRGETLEEFDLQRLVGGPGGGEVAERNGEIVNLKVIPIFKFPVCTHDSSSSSKSLYCMLMVSGIAVPEYHGKPRVAPYEEMRFSPSPAYSVFTPGDTSPHRLQRLW
jgi:hypothetical protein